MKCAGKTRSKRLIRARRGQLSHTLLLYTHILCTSLREHRPIILGPSSFSLTPSLSFSHSPSLSFRPSHCTPSPITVMVRYTGICQNIQRSQHIQRSLRDSAERGESPPLTRHVVAIRVREFSCFVGEQPMRSAAQDLIVLYGCCCMFSACRMQRGLRMKIGIRTRAGT